MRRPPVTAMLLLMSCIGCAGGEKLPTAPVEGVVTYNGAPVEGAQVSLISKTPEGKSANGLTDAAGHFTLSTYLGGAAQAIGAMPGDYSVTIRKRAALAGAGGTEPPKLDDAPVTKEASAAPPARRGPPGSQTSNPPAGMASYMSGEQMVGKSLIPEKYESPQKSGLTVTVKPAGNEPLKFELSD